jgi:hypothetical protein
MQRNSVVEHPPALEMAGCAPESFVCFTEAVESNEDDGRKSLRGKGPRGRSDGSSVDIGVENDLHGAVGCANHRAERSEFGRNGEKFGKRHLGGQITATDVDVERCCRHAINVGDRRLLYCYRHETPPCVTQV